MAFGDLREFIKALAAAGELTEVEGAHWDLEIGAITEVAARRPVQTALLFDRVADYPAGYRVLTGFVNSPRRAALALGLPPEASPVELVRLWKQRLRDVQPLPPRLVTDGPILEHVDTGADVNVLRFPVPKWHERDGGRYIGTSDMVIQQDPDDPSWTNVGAYRVQVHDERTLGIYVSRGHHGRIIMERYWERGEACPVAMSFGHEPATWVAITHAIPAGMSEYAYAGWVRGEPVDVVSGPLTGLPLPATSEIAIEGEIPPPGTDDRTEGPFGEWHGYYGTGETRQPVVRVKSVLYRSDPILTGAPPIKPQATGNPQVAIDFGSARIWQYLEDAGVPDVRGVYRFIAGQTSGYFIVVSIKQRHPGHSKQAAHAALGCYGGAYNGRFVVIVDDDIDPSNVDDVLWAIGTRCDPAETIDIARGAWSSALDPRVDPVNKARGNYTSGRAVIDACRPFHWAEGFPAVSTVSDALRAETEARWAHVFREMGRKSESAARPTTG
jgi:4-hydroxy-3-polyprenylbenzoate decarboxylase